MGKGKKQAVARRRHYASSASGFAHNLVKQTQIVLFHRANGKLQVSTRCFHGARTISLASIRVPTMRMRTLRPLTMLCVVSTGWTRAPTHVRRRSELGRVRVRLELVVDRQQVGRHEHAQRAHLAEEAHLVHVGDPRAITSPLNCGVVSEHDRRSHIPASARSPGTCCETRQGPCRGSPCTVPRPSRTPL